MPQYSNLTYFDFSGYPQNLGDDPNNWPNHYVDNNNDDYFLQCMCDDAVQIVGETTEPVTLAVCDSINGNWFPNTPHPVPIPPEHLGSCQAPPSPITTCSGYLPYGSINGVGISWYVAKITVPPNLPYYAGDLVIDPCALNSYTINGQTVPGVISFPQKESGGTRKQYIDYCHSLSEILPCNPKMSYMRLQYPIKISNTNITVTSNTTTTPNSNTPWGYIGGAAAGTVTIVAGIWALFSGGNNPPPPPPKPPKPVTAVPNGFTLPVAAGLGLDQMKINGILEAAGYLAAGVITGIVIVGAVGAAPGLAVGGAVLVIVYKADGSADVLTIDIPADGA